MVTLEALYGVLKTMQQELTSEKPPEPLWLTADVWDMMNNEGWDMSGVERIEMKGVEL